LIVQLVANGLGDANVALEARAEPEFIYKYLR
jgi:hypothetical protein